MCVSIKLFYPNIIAADGNFEIAFELLVDSLFHAVYSNPYILMFDFFITIFV